MRTIEIGIEVHKAIEAERGSLDELENAILMRLLGLKPSAATPPSPVQTGGAAWTGEGVELPEGTLVRVNYSGQQVDGVIADGKWLIRGKAYASPSMALIHNVTTRSGKQTNLNGWNHWTARRPGDAGYIRLADLRARRRPN